MARQLERAGFPVSAADLVIYSTVPVGSGLSSSAALEVSSALALLGKTGVRADANWRSCASGRNEFVGMPCGIMDQYVSVFAASPERRWKSIAGVSSTKT